MATTTDRPALRSLVESLHAEATRTNERRLLVLCGDRSDCIDAAYTAIEAAGAAKSDVTLVTTEEGFRYDRVHPDRSTQLLGQTREIVVLDCHDRWSPNTIGRTVGAVDGGGLYVLLTPRFSDWSNETSALAAGLTAPPYELAAVGDRTQSRVIETVRTHPGVAIVQLDELNTPGSTDEGGSDESGEASTIHRDGLTGGSGVPSPSPPGVPRGSSFPDVVYETCATRDQRRAVRSLERLSGPGNACVLEADRGRGKSTAAGLAAGVFAADGRTVQVTAPDRSNADTLLDRAQETLSALGVDYETADADRQSVIDCGGDRGVIQFDRPTDAIERAAEADVLLVEEAAGLPVRVLSALCTADSIGFLTTIRGYEGAGRGFTVRFRDRLDESAYAVRTVELTEPIRYAAGDPIESWSFRTLCLDASPTPGSIVAGTDPTDATYEQLTQAQLASDERLLRQTFGLLVDAHYRTTPDDLGRMLDGPNLSVRAFTIDGHVAAVALLAAEGGLDEETREQIYRGERTRGHLVPELLTSQLRDEEAGVPTSQRIVRIATHAQLRGEGFGSRLLSAIAREFESRVDYLAVAYGATPRLLRFWIKNGYRTVYLSATEHDTSGEHSAIMLRPCSSAGEALADRHSEWFTSQLQSSLSGPLSTVDPDVVRWTLRSVDGSIDPELTDREERFVAGMAFGPGMYGAGPTGFETLALAELADPSGDLDPREERLLVTVVLQGRSWEAASELLEYNSPGHCMRSLGRAYRPIAERFGGELTRAERRRYE
ncbi:tRNA(Met) cytidine acetyltransferase TmcA [Halalkalirubrum salinum]|uniref:tRNA(Met) cytidine acetyltransferase TmcA n=1 Tax=Halalkalirubrum salinum TaxID=2563889 RepID=UPI0010FB2A68|nr:tRNA(Met) cytidine acetyltransferase TmcA [Halalkalirubrum salinum]